MARADVMEYASHRSAHAGIEALGRVHMNDAAHELTIGMLDAVMGGEVVAYPRR